MNTQKKYTIYQIRKLKLLLAIKTGLPATSYPSIKSIAKKMGIKKDTNTQTYLFTEEQISKHNEIVQNIHNYLSTEQANTDLQIK